jgi:hypothetical protein
MKNRATQNIGSEEETAVFIFEETPTGRVIVQTPNGERMLLETEEEDAYHRETILAERLASTLAPKLFAQSKRMPARAEPPLPTGEHLYSPAELAKVLSLDPSTVRRLFLDEPGVIKLGKENRHDGKREYLTLRIPASVAQRVLRERTSRRR